MIRKILKSSFWTAFSVTLCLGLVALTYYYLHDNNVTLREHNLKWEKDYEGLATSHEELLHHLAIYDVPALAGYISMCPICQLCAQHAMFHDIDLLKDDCDNCNLCHTNWVVKRSSDWLLNQMGGHTPQMLDFMTERTPRMRSEPHGDWEGF